MYRILLSPRWIAASLIVAVLAGVFCLLGLWQLDRLEDRKRQNSLFESRRAGPAADLNQIGTLDASQPDAVGRLTFRRARAKGTYDPQGEVLLDGRADLGRPGRHVLTPLKLKDNVAIIVNRGWVPMELDEPPVAQAPPPDGVVEVEGVLLPPEPRRTVGPEEPPPGRVERLTRVDLERLDAQLPLDVFPLLLQLEKQKPPVRGPLPKAAPVLQPDEGSHLSYAIQWFSFAAIAVATFLAYARKQAADRYRAEVSRLADSS